MWQVDKRELSEKVTKYKIETDIGFLTNQGFIEALSADKIFRNFYNTILANSNYTAFFWENRSMNSSKLNENYEFVLVNSPSMSSLPVDIKAFDYYFTDSADVVDFPNLGGDAHLVVPCPISQPENYTHLANFVRNAPETQIDLFWNMIGIQYHQKIGIETKWLSTAGFGVYYLHARIDSRPKYYRYEPYK